MEEIMEDGHMRITATLAAKGRFIDITIHMGSMEMTEEQ